MYKFNTLRFRHDVIEVIEQIGWDEFRNRAKTTDKVVCRVLGWTPGTISVHTVANFCNAMQRSPLIYFMDNSIRKNSGFYE